MRFLNSLLLASSLVLCVNAQENLSGPPLRTVAEIVNQKNPASMSGRPVQLSSAEVRQVLGRQVLLVGDSGQKEGTLLVRLAKPLAGVRKGSVVALEGLLNQTPVQLQTWDVDNSVATVVKGHKVYVNVTQARLAGTGPVKGAAAGTNQPAGR